jgi:hypothetical protein
VILRTSARLKIFNSGSNWVCFAKMALYFLMLSWAKVRVKANPTSLDLVLLIYFGFLSDSLCLYGTGSKDKYPVNSGGIQLLKGKDQVLSNEF